MKKKIAWEKGLFRLYIIPNLLGLCVLGFAVYYYVAEDIGSKMDYSYYGSFIDSVIHSQVDSFYLFIKIGGALLLLPWIIHFAVKKIISPVFRWFASGFKEKN